MGSIGKGYLPRMKLQGMTNGGIASLSLFYNISFDTKAHDRQNTLFDVGRWMFDAYSPPEDSTFISFLFDLTGRLRPAAALV
jgi:hypothetical protein